MVKVFLAMVMMACLAGCTDNQRARQLGGTAVEELPAGRKLVMATWKQNDLWMLTRPMQPNEQPTTYGFKESSSYGLMNGTVVIHEVK